MKAQFLTTGGFSKEGEVETTGDGHSEQPIQTVFFPKDDKTGLGIQFDLLAIKTDVAGEKIAVYTERQSGRGF